MLTGFESFGDRGAGADAAAAANATAVDSNIMSRRGRRLQPVGRWHGSPSWPTHYPLVSSEVHLASVWNTTH